MYLSQNGTNLQHMKLHNLKGYNLPVTISLDDRLLVFILRVGISHGNKLFVLPKLTNIITETAESIAESECNRNADSITEMASFITDATK